MEFSFSNVAIHMKSLGISVEETGAIYGLSAVVGVLTPLGLGLNVSAIIEECGSVYYNDEKSYGWSGPETSPSFVNETDKMLPSGKEFSGAVFFPRHYSLDVTCSAAETFGSSEIDYTLNRRTSIEQNQAKILIGLELPIGGNTTGKYRVNWMTAEDGTKIGQNANNFGVVLMRKSRHSGTQ